MAPQYTTQQQHSQMSALVSASAAPKATSLPLTPIPLVSSSSLQLPLPQQKHNIHHHHQSQTQQQTTPAIVRLNSLGNMNCLGGGADGCGDDGGTTLHTSQSYHNGHNHNVGCGIEQKLEQQEQQQIFFPSSHFEVEPKVVTVPTTNTTTNIACYPPQPISSLSSYHHFINNEYHDNINNQQSHLLPPIRAHSVQGYRSIFGYNDDVDIVDNRYDRYLNHHHQFSHSSMSNYPMLINHNHDNINNNNVNTETEVTNREPDVDDNVDISDMKRYQRRRFASYPMHDQQQSHYLHYFRHQYQNQLMHRHPSHHRDLHSPPNRYHSKQLPMPYFHHDYSQHKVSHLPPYSSYHDLYQPYPTNSTSAAAPIPVQPVQSQAIQLQSVVVQNSQQQQQPYLHFQDSQQKQLFHHHPTHSSTFPSTLSSMKSGKQQHYYQQQHHGLGTGLMAQVNVNDVSYVIDHLDRHHESRPLPPQLRSHHAMIGDCGGHRGSIRPISHSVPPPGVELSVSTPFIMTSFDPHHSRRSRTNMIRKQHNFESGTETEETEIGGINNHHFRTSRVRGCSVPAPLNMEQQQSINVTYNPTVRLSYEVKKLL